MHVWVTNMKILISFRLSLQIIDLCQRWRTAKIGFSDVSEITSRFAYFVVSVLVLLLSSLLIQFLNIKCRGRRAKDGCNRW